MTDQSAADGMARRGEVGSSRNHWRRLAELLEVARAGDPGAAWRDLERLRRSDVLGARAVASARALVEPMLAQAGGPRADLPFDYLRDAPGKRFAPALRQLGAPGRRFRDFPSDMILPPIVGNANDFRHLVDVSRVVGFGAALPTFRLCLVVAVEDDAGMRRLAALLTRAMRDCPGLDTRSSLVVRVPAVVERPALPCPVRFTEREVFRLPPDTQMSLVAQDSDGICFLPVEALEDPLLIERVLRQLSVSRLACLSLQPMSDLHDAGAGIPAPTPLADAALTADWIRKAVPHLDVRPMAFALDADLFRTVGGFDPRFATAGFATTHLAFAAANRGGYLMPLPVAAALPVPAVSGEDLAADRARFVRVCPETRDRAPAETYDVPRVSIYIPAFQAQRFLKEAIDSVLAQDYSDLEVCVADDGSPDGTLEVLEAYGGEPRVRHVTGPNGGIGHASNRAIALTRGMYVGQLDADDRLRPGAVRRLAEYLDANRNVGCVYGSCERIDENGHRIGDEYNWRDYSREKMMLTSIVHHFRMFRRQAWDRTEAFRDDIGNAVDYDMFLKLSEVTRLHHVDEVLYQRRWHGANTSDVDEAHQTANTHVVQRFALERMGLDRYWDVCVPDPAKPRKVSYRREGVLDRVYFWPDYSRTNPYQRLLYGPAEAKAEFVGGDIERALAAIGGQPAQDAGRIVFHLHWLNKLFQKAGSVADALAAAEAFLGHVRRFKLLGGRFVWTVHNVASHDTPFPAIERNLSRELVALADAIHLHCAASLPEIEASFPVPGDKVRVARHGAFLGAYPDFVDRARARATLGLAPEDDVIVFLGQIRPYKGIDLLLAAFRDVLRRRPTARLLLAGSRPAETFLDAAGLSPEERSRIVLVNRFIDDPEIHLFFRAADMAVFPYTKILTSGSLLLSLGFGVPTIIPDYAMTRELLGDGRAGAVYPPTGGVAALIGAIDALFARLDAGEGPEMTRAALDVARRQTWDDLIPVLFGDQDQETA